MLRGGIALEKVSFWWFSSLLLAFLPLGSICYKDLKSLVSLHRPTFYQNKMQKRRFLHIYHPLVRMPCITCAKILYEFLIANILHCMFATGSEDILSAQLLIFTAYFISLHVQPFLALSTSEEGIYWKRFVHSREVWFISWSISSGALGGATEEPAVDISRWSFKGNLGSNTIKRERKQETK